VEPSGELERIRKTIDSKSLIRLYPKLSDLIRVPVLNEYHLVTFQTFNYNRLPFIKDLVAL
jgi:hypothetical protein